MKIHIPILLVLLVSLYGCCSVCRYRYKHSLPLEHTSWHLVKLGGDNVTLPENEFNIFLSDGRIRISERGEQISGSYTLGERKVLEINVCDSISHSSSQSKELSESFRSALASTTHYDIDYDMLLILSNGAIKAIFRAVPENKDHRTEDTVTSKKSRGIPRLEIGK